MTDGLGGDGLLGGGQDDVCRDMLSQEFATLISWTGGIAAADAVLRDISKAQEVA